MPSPLPRDGGPEKVQAADLDEHDTTSLQDEVAGAEPQDVPAQEQDTDPGIDDTLEVLDAIEASYSAISPILEGRYMEALTSVTQSFDEYADALEGASEVPSEVADLDAEETRQLASKALSIVKNLTDVEDT